MSEPDRTRPKFRTPKADAVPPSPEQLFYKLGQREKTHEYLRGPQQDILRDYSKLESGVRDVALELPTGTGKTAVGLLVAEWHRRQSSRPVAYLALTNQLAKQTLAEAARLGIPCADLIGTKQTRDAVEQGRYRTGEAVGVTSYSNLFNINPVIQASEVLVLDDAHGGESYAAANWTVRLDRASSAFFDPVVTALRPAMTESQVRLVTDTDSYSVVDAVDVGRNPETLGEIRRVLDESNDDQILFQWRQIRDSLEACVFLISSASVAIRPVIPPTHTHGPFADSTRRIYMSATLGGAGDLQRAYGLEYVEIIRAEQPQWGRRYVLIPSMYMESEQAWEIVVRLWSGMAPKRAVMLAPSRWHAESACEELDARCDPLPVRFSASDVSDSLEPFTAADNAVLVLAGRYDGIDLPGDNCRLLMMVESPAAIGELERHLRDRWKLGPVLRQRERTRLIQGMGRCTRSAADFSIVLWLGQSLVNAVTSPLVHSIPPEIRAEIEWGREQSKLGVENPEALVDMVRGLLEDEEYRSEADQSIDSTRATLGPAEEPSMDTTARDEVRYARGMWSGDVSGAYAAARTVADNAGGNELAGFRGWWWVLAAWAAERQGDTEAVHDCLNRARGVGVNAGWVDTISRRRSPARQQSVSVSFNAQGIWDELDRLGWAGAKFQRGIDEMLADISQDEHTRFHMGGEALGRCLGLGVWRPTEDGAPDVVWQVEPHGYVAFEAKTEKGAGTKLSKDDVLRASGHVNWVRAMLEVPDSRPVEAVVVSPTVELYDIAEPHAKGLYCLHPDEIRGLAKSVADVLGNLRMQFAGRSYAASAGEFSAVVTGLRLDDQSIWDRLRGTLLLS